MGVYGLYSMQDRRTIVKNLLRLAAFGAVFAYSSVSPAASPVPVSRGLIAQGSWLFCGDQEAMFHILYKDVPFIHGIGIFSGLNGYTTPENLEMKAYERGEGRVTYRGKVRGMDIAFEQKAEIDGNRIKVTVRRTGKWPSGVWGGIQIPILIEGRSGTVYKADGKEFVFPEQYDPQYKFPTGFNRLELAPSDPGVNLVFECAEGMGLDDHRRFQSPRFIISIPLPRDGQDAVVWYLTFPASIGPAVSSLRWSRIGYPLGAKKSVVMEWPRNMERPEDAVRVEDSGGKTVLTGRFGHTEAVDWLQNNFASFDFSGLSEPGEYRIVWSGGRTGLFPVKASVFGDRLWQPTLDTFVPFLMCHASVDLGTNVTGHGLCHADDAERVKPHYTGPDGFVSYESEGTPWKAGEHIPLGTGGWHDAGDFDLNVPAQSFVTWLLSLTWEEFKPERDVNTLDTSARTFRAGTPDGVPDLFQQVEWGALWLLSVQQKDGRVWNGVCEKPAQRSGKPLETITDGIPGNADDRQVYVDYHADQQLDHVIAMAAASRALKAVRPALAKRCLESARKGFRYFQTHKEIYRPGSYTAESFQSEGRDASLAAAAVELFISTGHRDYLEVLRGLSDRLRKLTFEWPMPRETGTGGFRYAPPFIARLIPLLKPEDEELRKIAMSVCIRAGRQQSTWMELRPWPLNEWHFGRWGNSTTGLARAFDTYWLNKVVPKALPAEAPLRNMLWLFGLHPTCDTVLVSGLGYPETKFLYNIHLQALNGFAPMNIPGAVIPGMGGFWYSGIAAYIDEYGYYSMNEACIYTQAQYIFAVNAMKAMGF
jgi:hypothetical protein